MKSAYFHQINRGGEKCDFQLRIEAHLVVCVCLCRPKLRAERGKYRRFRPFPWQLQTSDKILDKGCILRVRTRALLKLPYLEHSMKASPMFNQVCSNTRCSRIHEVQEMHQCTGQLRDSILGRFFFLARFTPFLMPVFLV